MIKNVEYIKYFQYNNRYSSEQSHSTYFMSILLQNLSRLASQNILHILSDFCLIFCISYI